MNWVAGKPDGPDPTAMQHYVEVTLHTNAILPGLMATGARGTWVA
jgi:hypothetical protein